MHHTSHIPTICVIGGDGIGPEVVEAALRVLKATGLDYHLTHADAGFGAYEKFQTPLPDETVKRCKEADAILFGAVTTPPNIPEYFSPIVRLRQTLGLFANVRPFVSLPIPDSKPGVNCIIVRENTEDLYGGKEYEIPEGVIAERKITSHACERILRFAFELARSQHRHRVTAVHKANVLRLSDGLFLRIAQQVAQEYPDISYDDMLVDSCGLQLVRKAETFDVIVTTNMFGDILSDVAAGIVGGLGVVASANIGKTQALFEPIHGSAPKYTNTNIANPTAAFGALCLLLSHLGYHEQATHIQKAIHTTLTQGCKTKDVGGDATQRQFTDTVIQRMKGAV